MSRPWTIRARALSKVYRLYARPAYRFLDLLALCPSGARYYSEHTAVDRVELTIDRGEKVAIIGRNGAGKSTLLKLISGVVRPTSGFLEVRGSIKALLEIGTGFHPEFTGRDNVLSSLAYQGIVGAAARSKLEEIVDFAELEEYIDQPMKTYSTGMKMRLMFSAATSVDPDILVVDEVLSVGDAYFTHKSLDRTRRMVETQGTTLLLVTHDPATAVNICDRFIWIDRGRVMLDGSAGEAMAAYEHSIKEQEERRQRLRKIRAAESGVPIPPVAGLTVRIRPDAAPRLDAPLRLASLVASWADGRRERCAWGPGGAAATFRLLPSMAVVEEAHAGRACATLREYGDIFHQMDCWLAVPEGAKAPTALEIEYSTTASTPVLVEVSADAQVFTPVGRLAPSVSAGWTLVRVDLTPAIPEARRSMSAPTEPPPVAGMAPEQRVTRRYGLGTLVIREIRLLDEVGEPSRVFRHGATLRFEVDCELLDASLAGRPILAGAGIHKGGYLGVTSFVSPPFHLSGRSGTLTLSVENLRLTPGQYVLAFGLFRPEYATRGLFFTMSPDVYDHIPCAAQFDVISDDTAATGWVYVQEAKWSLPG